jgi:hypothetical protein
MIEPDREADERAAQWDCTQLLIRFFNAFDAFRYDEMASLFAPDGVWHRQGRALAGRAAILAALGDRSPTQTVRHIVTNVEIAVTGRDVARSLLYLTAYSHDSGAAPREPAEIAAPSLLLTVPGSLVRTNDGWRIASLTMTRTFVFKPQPHS